MTEKQAERLRIKIKQAKAALAADKRRWGGFYDDSRGLRYVPPGYYIKLGDWKEGVKYLKWFAKNFPDDGGYPTFLFECAIILFKSGDVKLAEKKVFQVFRSNTYVIEKFFGRAIIPIDKYENSNISIPAYAETFIYSCDEDYLADFSNWLLDFTKTEKFVTASQKFVDLYKRLKTEKDYETRVYLVRGARQLEEDF